MSDLIERQVAIDAINKLHEKSNKWLDRAVEELKELPSAICPHCGSEIKEKDGGSNNE